MAQRHHNDNNPPTTAGLSTMSAPAPAAATRPMGNGGGANRACYKCGKTGHWSRDCTAPREEWIPQQPRDLLSQPAPGAGGPLGSQDGGEDGGMGQNMSKAAASAKKSNRKPKFTVRRLPRLRRHTTRRRRTRAAQQHAHADKNRKISLIHNSLTNGFLNASKRALFIYFVSFPSLYHHHDFVFIPSRARVSYVRD